VGSKQESLVLLVFLFRLLRHRGSQGFLDNLGLLKHPRQEIYILSGNVNVIPPVRIPRMFSILPLSKRVGLTVDISCRPWSDTSAKPTVYEKQHQAKHVVAFAMHKNGYPLVPTFTPNLSSDPSSPTYSKYCRLALVRYRPWEGKSQSDAYGGSDASYDDIVEAWNTFLTESDVDTLPDALQK
jgi:hypothetical protein